MTKLPSPVRLTIEAAKDLWKWKRSLIPVVLVVAIPVSLLFYLTGDADPTLSAYSAFGTLFMNVALIWSVMRLHEGKTVTVRSAYYQGTAATLRLLLISGLYLLMALPFLIGAVIYINGSIGDAPVTGLGENLLLLAVWLLLSLPSMYWLTRSVMGIFALDSGAGPIEASRASRALVQGKALAVFGRLAWLVMLLVMLVTIPAYVMLSSFSEEAAIIGSTILQLLSSLVVVPFSYLYLYRLYSQLKAAVPVEKATKGA